MIPEQETDRLHHLSRDSRGRWEIRVTVDQGKAFVGKPLRIKIGKVTEREAIRRRDQQLAALSKAGLSVKLRKQKRLVKRPRPDCD